MTDLGTLGGSDSMGYGINNVGQIVGFSFTTNNGAEDAFLYSNGTMTDLGPLLGGGGDNLAYAINDSAQITGYSWPGVDGYHAFLYQGGQAQDLGTLGGGFSVGTAINNLGQVAGYSEIAIGGGVQHPFLYSNGRMQDLGSLGGSLDTVGGGRPSINNAGQIVGSSNAPDDSVHAFFYANGVMTDLNSSLPLNSGWVLNSANAINDSGQIVGLGTLNGQTHGFLLENVAVNSPLLVLNPFAPYALSNQAPPALDVPTVLNSPSATGVAADGESAVVLAYQSKSPEPVTFALSTSGLPSGVTAGSLASFDPNYLASPFPSGGNGPQSYETTPSYGPDGAGNYTFLALLWAPSAMPVPNVFPLVNLTATATQQGGLGPVPQASIALKPPPLLLVHGIWSGADTWLTFGSQEGFYSWISGQYPHNLIYAVDYNDPRVTPNLNSQAFSDPRIQKILLSNMTDALTWAARAGLAARTIDVVGHSMGGLVTRYFLSTAGYLGNPALLPSPVHKLITIGTPHQGTPLATLLWQGAPLTQVRHD
jgi:probable HAF family extracellular repeat protein